MKFLKAMALATVTTAASQAHAQIPSASGSNDPQQIWSSLIDWAVGFGMEIGGGILVLCLIALGVKTMAGRGFDSPWIGRLIAGGIVVGSAFFLADVVINGV